ncbi:antibiotic ABC transporter permease [Halapricum desulfuricans]|nr:antibiotic ABC transporter permease [Halapricum desulfuricans]
MDSRLRRAIPVDSKWLNIAFQETAKRFPVNIRPLLGVTQRPNYQGHALFAMANQTLDRIEAGERGRRLGVDYGEEARTLAEWLVENRTQGYSGYCASYPHPIQHLDGLGEPGEPDIVNTSFGVEALVRAGEFDASYPEVAESARDFVLDDLDYRPAESGRGAVIDYHTKHPQEYYTINAGALCARLFLDLYDHFENPADLDRARELLDHIEDLQTDRGGWKYRDPPDSSHLSMDTHHNGFIIESYQRYRDVVEDGRYDDTLDDALAFFRGELFADNGAPNFDERSTFPRDIHASTQGVLVFTYAGDLAFARRILQWVFENLYVGDGQFYYRKERFFTRRVTLMRWCQAWMAFAISEYLDAYTDGQGDRTGA